MQTILLSNKRHCSGSPLRTLHASRLSSLVHLTLIIPSWTVNLGDQVGFVTAIRNSTAFLSHGVPPSLETLTFVFNRDSRFKLPLPEDAMRAMAVVNRFVRLFSNGTIADTVETTFKLLNMRKNQVSSRTKVLKDMFKASQIPDWPRIITFGMLDEGKSHSCAAHYSSMSSIHCNYRERSSKIMRSRLSFRSDPNQLFSQWSLGSECRSATTRQKHSRNIFCDTLACCAAGVQICGRI